MRLDRFLSNQLGAARREAKELVKSGSVTLNGLPVRDPAVSVDPEKDLVSVRGEPVTYQEHLYLMLNKPKGVICSTEDGRHRTVLDLLPESVRRKGLFPAGRLDIDTEGFVLITDDGAFAHRILSPKRHVSKTYLAVLDSPLGEDAADRFREGIVLPDGTACLPAELTVLEQGDEPVVKVVLFEGKYHQVKRMFEVLGTRVKDLRRVKIGDLELDKTLASGEVREILHKELALILGTNATKKGGSADF